MRHLVIMCEPRHAGQIRDGLARHAHPRLLDKHVHLYELDMDQDLEFASKRREIAAYLENLPQGDLPLSHGPLVLATREIGQKLKLPQFINLLGLEYEPVSAQSLCKWNHGDGTPLLKRHLNGCQLSLVHGSALLLSQWSHQTLGLVEIQQWLTQFGDLGKYRWLGEEILRGLRMLGHVELGNTLAGLVSNSNAGLCVNRDDRSHGKSGEVIANLITKRLPGNVYESPARAIDGNGLSEIILFEDGLWSGTEVVGVLDSLRGRRPGREKTAPLLDPSKLQSIDITLAYAVATDYGQAIVSRYLDEAGLNTKIRVKAAEIVSIASPELLSDIASGQFSLAQHATAGPPVGQINPQITLSLENCTWVSDDIKCDGINMCISIGQQLFDNYLSRQIALGWDPWADEKRTRCALGMHGLGLTHAFSHSVPKATLPLLWSSGPVIWNGKTVNWKPLFVNA